MGFQSFALADVLLASLNKMNFKVPTPVQEQTIPVVLKGQDVLVSSQTGTGKTGAFSIPIISQILADKNKKALIITPTRELASQVMKSFHTFMSQRAFIKTALLIGGDSFHKQLKELKRNPNIIVGTPGRINDHLNRKSVDLSEFNFLVLDETDRMLDMGFSVQIDEIVKYLPSNRQTLLFSATLPKNIINLSQKYMQDPQRIAIGLVSNPVEKIKQESLNIAEKDKYPELLSQLEEREGSVIIFVKTKHGTEKMAERLKLEGYAAEAIHGDLKHTKRERVIKAFRNQKYKILVATDVAARGLDIPHIQHVINYDLPQCPEDYIHRIGRTARAGQEGSSLSFISPSDKRRWNDIYCLLNPGAKRPKSGGKPSNSRGKPNASRSRRGGGFSNSKPKHSSENNNTAFYGAENTNTRGESNRRGGAFSKGKRESNRADNYGNTKGYDSSNRDGFEKRGFNKRDGGFTRGSRGDNLESRGSFNKSSSFYGKRDFDTRDSNSREAFDSNHKRDFNKSGKKGAFGEGFGKRLGKMFGKGKPKHEASTFDGNTKGYEGSNRGGDFAGKRGGFGKTSNSGFGKSFGRGKPRHEDGKIYDGFNNKGDGFSRRENNGRGGFKAKSKDRNHRDSNGKTFDSFGKTKGKPSFKQDDGKKPFGDKARGKFGSKPSFGKRNKVSA